MYKNGFKALEDEIRTAIQAKCIVNQYKELLLKQPEESIKNYNNFLYLQKKRKVDKKKREISKDFKV